MIYRILAAVFAFLLLVLVYFIVQYRIKLKGKDYADCTDAEVVKTKKQLVTRGTEYRVNLRYRAMGKTYRAKMYCGHGSCPYEKGDILTLYYDCAHPKRYHIPDYKDELADAGMNIMLPAFLMFMELTVFFISRPSVEKIFDCILDAVNFAKYIIFAVLSVMCIISAFGKGEKVSKRIVNFLSGILLLILCAAMITAEYFADFAEQCAESILN